MRTEKVVLNLRNGIQDLIFHRLRIHIGPRAVRIDDGDFYFAANSRTLQTCSLLQATRTPQDSLSKPVRKGYLSHENVSVRQRTESAASTHSGFNISRQWTTTSGCTSRCSFGLLC